MKINESESFPEIMIIQPKVFKDARGSFFELYHRSSYCNNGLSAEFVQDNCSHSIRNVLRGLHYQIQSPQGKLVCVLEGEVFDVAVDIRRHSPSFGQYYSRILSSRDYIQLYIPPGFAHGFVVLSDYARFYYKCTDFYNPDYERGIRWNDPVLGIKWPIENPILSVKDRSFPTIDSISADDLFD